MNPEKLLRLDDDVPNTGAESISRQHIQGLLQNFYQKEGWLVSNLNTYLSKRLVALPDLAVYPIHLEYEERVRINHGWRLGKLNRPSPILVIDTIWYYKREQNPFDKVARYGQVGVKEYFAFNPNPESVWPEATFSLLGWRYENGKPKELKPNEQGWLWSNVLESWLAVDKPYLYLHYQNGQRRLSTGDEHVITNIKLETLLAKLKKHGIDPDKL